MNRILLVAGRWICTLLTTFGIFASGCKKQKYTWETKDEYFRLPLWSQHVKSYRKIKFPPHTATVFIGDSMTEGFDLPRFFKSDSVVNMGISGDFTSGVLKRLGPVEKLQPKKIFIMIGINDILKLVPQERIERQYAAILDQLKKDCPRAEIYVQGNLPTSCMGGEELSNAVVVNRVRQLNQFLRAQCAEKGITFIDLYPAFEVDGSELNGDCTYDGLHLSEMGYQVWTDEVRKFVE